jgi:hypothetical protein
MALVLCNWRPPAITAVSTDTTTTAPEATHADRWGDLLAELTAHKEEAKRTRELAQR